MSGVSGVVKDVGGTPVEGAKVTLVGPSGLQRQTVADDDGAFTFEGLPAGKYTVTVSGEGLSTQTAGLTLSDAEQKMLPSFALTIATARFEVDAESQVQLANEQVKEEEKQRILGVIPNFYVAYDPNTVPIDLAQKFRLAARTIIDPVTLVATGINAGVSQATQTPIEWGQNFKGYAQRFGASYAGAVAGIGLSGAVYPSLFHEDPRYFFKGTGSTWSRLRWSLKQAVEQRDDHGRWRPAYSNTLGDLSASLVTTAIYPHQTTAWGKTAAVGAWNQHCERGIRGPDGGVCGAEAAAVQAEANADAVEVRGRVTRSAAR